MSFGWTDLKVQMPLIGLIARNSKNLEVGRNGWMNAEEKLCGVYKRYVSQLPEDKFLQRIEYMKHAGDLGRTPMGIGLKIFLFILVAAEAMGFSYILGTWAASEGSANLYTKLMYGIVFVLASILAIVTHKAGEQFYRTRLIRSCFKRYKEDNDQDFSTRVISLSDDQFADEKDPPHTRTVNRIIENPHDHGSFGWSWVAGIFVALIFIGSATMRVSHMETELNRQTQATDATISNPFAPSNALPAEVVSPQQEADKKAKAEERSSTQVEGIAAILVLSVIFVVTQIVGFGAGHKHSFAGKETYKKAAGSNAFWWWSEKDGAYADTWGYSTYDSYWEAMQPIKDIVNTRLKDLQHSLKENSHKNLNLTKSFDDYLDEMFAISKRGRAKKNMPDAQINQETVQNTEPAPEESIPSSVDKAKADIEAISNKLAQQEYYKNLPPEIREELKPWLKQRKDQAAVVPQAELDELF